MKWRSAHTGSPIRTPWWPCGGRAGWSGRGTDPVKDIRRKLGVQRDLFLVGSLDGRLVATMMVGYEGHRGWVNYLAVAADCRKRGLGRTLMSEAEARLREMGCPKVSLQIRRSNADVVSFYRSIGYSEDDVVSMGKRLIED